MKEKFINLKNKAAKFLNRIGESLKQNKKVSIIVLALVVIAILVIIVFCSFKKEDYKPGNLYNLGFSASDGKTTYYLGYKEGTTDGIYKINTKNSEKISNDYGYYLNKSGDYIYYLDSNNNIVKIKTNGKEKQIIVEDVETQAITVKDDYIYYFSNSYFYRVKTNGSNKKIISDKSIVNYQIVGNRIYYVYIDNGNFAIAKMKTNGENNKKIDSNCGKAFWVNGKYIYYIYENTNQETHALTYELCKMKNDGSKKEKITEIDGIIDRATVNFYKDFVYYVKRTVDGGDSIYRINLNGEDEIKIVDINGFSTKININNNWIYYPDENEIGDVQMFRIKLDGKTEKEKI